MKTILYITLILLLFSCSKSMHVYERKTMLPNEIHITFKTEREAIRVQKRITKHCSTPRRYVKTLYLDKEHIECNRRIFGNNYGFIRDKYRNQIDKQLK